MRQNPSIIPVAALLLALCASSVAPVAAAAGKHVHGEALVNIAVEGELLVLEVQAPAVDVLGFERRPTTDAQREAVTQAEAWFASGRRMLGVPPSAACRLQTVDFQGPKLGSGHADYRARYTFRCAAPAALVYAELWLLEGLRSIERVQVNLLTATTQTQLTLNANSNRRIVLR